MNVVESNTDIAIASPALPHLIVSAEAERGMARICAATGPQVIVASWPSGAAYLPHELFTSSPYDIIIDDVAGCPIYADRRQLAYYAERHAILDISYLDVQHKRALLILRETVAARSN